jgi:hypothetical protein
MLQANTQKNAQANKVLSELHAQRKKKEILKQRLGKILMRAVFGERIKCISGTAFYSSH